MLNVFKGTLLALVRDKSIFIWLLAFPLILSTMFMLMFSNLDDTGQLEPIATGVVVDENYANTPAFSALMTSLSQDGENSLIALKEFDDEQQAKKALVGTDEDADAATDSADEGIVGYFTIDDSGTPLLHVEAGAAAESLKSINQSLLKTIADGYVRNAAFVENVYRENPQMIADPSFVESLFDRPALTERISVTHDTPKESVRYYFALLGMSALFGGQIGMTAICRAQPNLSPLGARHAVGGTSRTKTLAATLAASWLLTFCCLVIAFGYQRFVVGIDFGNRDAACILALAATALFSTSFGTLLGSLPKITTGVKIGLLTGITCLSAMFAGLYGQPTMRLADQLSESAPLVQMLNPATRVAETFYSLTYYDTYARTFESIAILLGLTVVLFAISALLIRRQRYASI